jgi:hypothetical protein
LIDEQALVRALTEDWIPREALDVLAQEPPGADNPLLASPNVILTLHAAAGTRDAYRTNTQAVLASVQQVARSEAPLHQVLKVGVRQLLNREPLTGWQADCQAIRCLAPGHLPRLDEFLVKSRGRKEDS